MNIEKIWLWKSSSIVMQKGRLIYHCKKVIPTTIIKSFNAMRDITAITLIEELNFICFTTRQNNVIRFISITDFKEVLTITTSLPEQFFVYL